MLHVSGQSSGQTFLKTVGSEFATWVGLQIMIVRCRRREIHPVSSTSGTIGDTLISAPIRRLQSWGVVTTQRRRDSAKESPLSKEILKELSQALSKIDRPGTFCVSGSVQTVLPGLEVDGLGPIGLPLTGNQAKDLKKLCEQAPYGKGEKTLVDTSVRRVWRLRPSQFSLRNPDWKQFLQETLSKVQAEL